MIKKTLSLLVVFIVINIATYGQKQNNKTSCAKFYLGTSTGLENPSGLLGFNIDVPVSGQFSLGGGVGLSTWGYKVYGEGRVYFGKCNRGWAIGAGVTYCTGNRSAQLDMDVVAAGTSGHFLAKKTVTLDLKPLTNAFISGYHFWKLGRRSHRFYLQTGYSMRLNSDNMYTIKSSDIVTSESKNKLEVLAPGGLMLAAGFSFALGK